MKGLEMFQVGKKYVAKGATVPGECKLITEGPYSTVVLVFKDGIAVNVSPNSKDWTEYKEPVTISRYIVVWSWNNDPQLAAISVARGGAKTEDEARKDFEGEETTIHKIFPITVTLDD